jgi:hypothetical protein
MATSLRLWCCAELSAAVAGFSLESLPALPRNQRYEAECSPQDGRTTCRESASAVEDVDLLA